MTSDSSKEDKRGTGTWGRQGLMIRTSNHLKAQCPGP